MTRATMFSRLVLLFALLAGAAGIVVADDSYTDTGQPVVEVALCLDTSGTMTDLLDTVQSDLWQMVNSVALADPPPRLRVALLSYGSKTRATEASGWVRIELPLTEDLDLLSERLFELSPGGDEEFPTRALWTAVEQLDWDQEPETRRLVLVVGDEAANQDSLIDAQEVADLAADRGVELHAVFCGNPRGNDVKTWTTLAAATGTPLAFLDLGGAAGIPATPYDRQLVELGDELTDTLVPLGESGAETLEKANRVDRRTLELGPAAAAARAEAKGVALGRQSWDLVAAVEAGRLDLAAEGNEDLPEMLRAMTPAERESYVWELQERRQQIRNEIAELARQRREFLDGQPINRSSLDTIVSSALEKERD